MYNLNVFLPIVVLVTYFFHLHPHTCSSYTIIVNDTGVQERKIGTCGTEAEHCPGTPLAQSVTVVSQAVSAGVRTVVLKRPFKGATSDHYSFSPDAVATMNYISAVGSSQSFAYHKIHDSLTLSFAPPAGPTCVCDVGSSGKLCRTGGQGCKSFKKNCVPHSPTLGMSVSVSAACLGTRQRSLAETHQYRPAFTYAHAHIQVLKANKAASCSLRTIQRAPPANTRFVGLAAF